MKHILLSLIFISTVTASVVGQGCVAIRQFSTCSPVLGQTNSSSGGEILVSMNYRYFKSFRHFRGTHEEPDRVTNNTEVINHSHAMDFQLAYAVTNRLQVNLTLPFVLNSRSSLYEHGREERNSTYSRGLADVVVGANYWLVNPLSNRNWNVQVGLGVKLPTGNYNFSDIFYNVGPSGGPETRPVDQSIQPGDGGFGALVQGQAYYFLSDRYDLFVSGFYLFNPRGVNGTRTFRETLSPILEPESIMSVPDQFSFRAGISGQISHGVSGFLGARYEGVPVHDVFGPSEGFRRPGNVLSVEPGINAMLGAWNLNFSVPIAVRRERPQSVTDMQVEESTGNPRNGDAAFADYLINVGVTYRIPSKKIE
ncbi:MAG: hypothetical protein P8X57_12950 [Cyclobacteriaceae bacterium]